MAADMVNIGNEEMYGNSFGAYIVDNDKEKGSDSSSSSAHENENEQVNDSNNSMYLSQFNNFSHEAHIISCDGKPSGVMISKKRPISGEFDENMDSKATSTKYKKRSIIWEYVVKHQGSGKSIA